MASTPMSNNRFTIDLAQRQRGYDINDVKYVVESRYMQATYSEKDRTLCDAIEEIINSEYIDISHK